MSLKTWVLKIKDKAAKKRESWGLDTPWHILCVSLIFITVFFAASPVAAIIVAAVCSLGRELIDVCIGGTLDSSMHDLKADFWGIAIGAACCILIEILK